MEKILYLMRHGQTLFNLEHKIQGWCDSPLTELGINQAKIAGRYFTDNKLKLDHCYSSTSERACDTLELVTGGKLPYTRLKGIKEWNFGCFEAMDDFLNRHCLMTTFLLSMAEKAKTESVREWLRP